MATTETEATANADYAAQIDQFEAHYDYNSDYLRELLRASPEGYSRFGAVQPLAAHRDLLDPETHWLVRLAAMLYEDCGECLQLTVKMALEAGMDRGLVTAALRMPDQLSRDQRDVYDYVTAVAAGDDVPVEMDERIRKRFDTGQLLEMGLAISAMKFFPTIKRAAGYAKSCKLVEITV